VPQEFNYRFSVAAVRVAKFFNFLEFELEGRNVRKLRGDFKEKCSKTVEHKVTRRRQVLGAFPPGIERYCVMKALGQVEERVQLIIVADGLPDYVSHTALLVEFNVLASYSAARILARICGAVFECMVTLAMTSGWADVILAKTISKPVVGCDLFQLSVGIETHMPGIGRRLAWRVIA
jgi:hypothetical protein